MTDEKPLPKRMGRPPKHPGQGKRFNVSLRVGQELYDQIVTAAAENGRSLSEEMEARVNQAFSKSAAEVTEKAVAAACQKMDEDHLKFFHGNDGRMWAKLSADLYRAVLMSTIVEVGEESASKFSGEFMSAFTANIKDGQDQVIKTWKSGMLFARLVERMSRPSFADAAREALSSNKDFVEKLENFASRAREEGAGES